MTENKIKRYKICPKLEIKKLCKGNRKSSKAVLHCSWHWSLQGQYLSDKSDDRRCCTILHKSAWDICIEQTKYAILQLIHYQDLTTLTQRLVLHQSGGEYYQKLIGGIRTCLTKKDVHCRGMSPVLADKSHIYGGRSHNL